MNGWSYCGTKSNLLLGSKRSALLRMTGQQRVGVTFLASSLERDGEPKAMLDLVVLRDGHVIAKGGPREVSEADRLPQGRVLLTPAGQALIPATDPKHFLSPRTISDGEELVVPRFPPTHSTPTRTSTSSRPANAVAVGLMPDVAYGLPIVQQRSDRIPIAHALLVREQHVAYLC